MKKICIVLILLIFLSIISLTYISNNRKYFNYEKIAPEETQANIYEYYIYGNHLNIKGSLKTADMNYKNISMVLYNKETKEIEVNFSNQKQKIDFNISEYINDGLYLDNIPRGNYKLFLKVTYKSPNDNKKQIIKYYSLKNNTKYKNTTYYTLTKYNNKITIDFDNKYKTMVLNIKKNKDDNIYDITIDPGHGGMDTGANNRTNYERDYTMAISLKIKKYLENSNFKVKLTHEENELTNNDLLEKYNTNGRAIIPNEVKSKYTFSIHLNMNTYKSARGFEIYTAKNINYDLAKKIATNLKNYTKLYYSTNETDKILDGIYSRNLTESDIKKTHSEYRRRGCKSNYKITENSSYYYMIRETGGYITGAYIDDRNEKIIGSNPYYNSNVGNESYLLELGYLSNYSDLIIIKSSINNIAKAIADAIIANIK